MAWISVLWIHLLAAMIWIGGMVFLTLVAAPSIKKSVPADVHGMLFRDIGRRFKLVGWVCIFILLLTGPMNIYHHVTHHRIDMGEEGSEGFHSILVMKLGLVLIMLIMSLIHDFVLGPLLGERMREGVQPSRILELTVPWMARINLILGLIVIYLGLTLAKIGMD